MSCSVHDVADLEERGVATVFIASDEFVSAREAQAAALGTDPFVVWLEHPIQDRTDAEMIAHADAVLEDIVAGPHISMNAQGIEDGLLVILKEECQTCVEILPAIRQIAESAHLTTVSQDDPGFPEGLAVIDDSDLDLSWALQTEVTPTLYRVKDGEAELLTIGWRRSDWRQATGITDLGAELPEHRPGCGSRIFEPGIYERLVAQHSDGPALDSRRVEIGGQEDEHEAMFARGWSDGLPLVPPTPERVAAMLNGTTRAADEIVDIVPPNLVELSVEKAAINAVMAGCLPEYFPVVLAAVEAVCDPVFNMHGVSATTYFSGPVLIVNGPVTSRIGMNSAHNAFGPGNRANATIGRAANLIVRNVGGAIPGGVDRSMQGHPAKWTLCFPEREHDSPWTSLAVERGFTPGESTVTAFAGQGPTPVVDQLSRQAETLAMTFAESLMTVAHSKIPMTFDAIVAISPEHARVFADSGWDKERLRAELQTLTTRAGSELVRGAGGMPEGVPESMAGADFPKFRPGGLWFVRVGSAAGLFSGIISGWVSGEGGSDIVTKAIRD